VNTQYLTVEIDIQIAMRMARGIAQAAVTPPFSDLIASDALAASGVPALSATDAEVRQWVLETYVATSYYPMMAHGFFSGRYTPGIHFVGSNSMMPQELGGVVSPELLVYGQSSVSAVLLKGESLFLSVLLD
jgi:choline dehydrogenase